MLKTFWNNFLSIVFPDTRFTARARSIDAQDLINSSLFAQEDSVLGDIGGFSLFRYHAPLIREMVALLKYKGDTKIAHVFAQALHEPLLSLLDASGIVALSEPIFIIPVPLHPSRERERGFNQSALIGRALVAEDHSHSLVIKEALVRRTRATKSQAKRERREDRFNNIKNCFLVSDPATIAGRVIVVIDDVITTGATMKEMKCVLENAGARQVIPVSIAH